MTFTVEDAVSRTFDLQPSGRRYLRGIKHDSLVVDRKRGLFFWNSKGLVGDAFDWLTKIAGMPEEKAKNLIGETGGYTRVVRDKENDDPIYPKLLDVFFELGKSNREYWYNRGYSDRIINFYKLGYTGKVYVIPLIVDGELKNFQCRMPTKDGKKVWNWASGRGPCLFGINTITSDILFLTESPVDAIAMRELGLNAISQNGGAGCWRNKWNKRILSYEKIYVIYDNDRAGIRGSKKVARKLLGRAYVLFWPNSFEEKFDVNDALLKFGRDKAKKLIRGLLVSEAIHSSDIESIDYRIIQSRIQDKLGEVL